MAVRLNPEEERIVDEELHSVQYRSAEEVIWQALQALRGKARSRNNLPLATVDKSLRRAAQAVGVELVVATDH